MMLKLKSPARIIRTSTRKERLAARIAKGIKRGSVIKTLCGVEMTVEGFDSEEFAVGRNFVGECRVSPTNVRVVAAA